MKRQKRQSYRRYCLKADREGDDRPDKRWFRPNNRKFRKRMMLDYRAAVQRAAELNQTIQQTTWPENHFLWTEFNRCHDRIVRGEKILGMKALLWKVEYRKRHR